MKIGGIVGETLARLRELEGGALEGLRVERAVVGIAFTGVKLSDGRAGMAGTPHFECSRPPKAPQDRPPGALRDCPVLSLFEPWPEDPFLDSLATAALNALCSRWLEKGPYRCVWDRDALDLMDVRPGMAVTLVGAFPSYIERLKAAGARLRVLELRESALREEHRGYFVPADRAHEVIPDSDMVLITGVTIPNGTLEDLLLLARPGAEAAVVGPSGSLLPDALFRRGATMASGCVLTQPDAALELISQGACARHLYGRCARKLNLIALL